MSVDVHVDPIRILVVDDHPVVRSGLVGMLAVESDFVIVGEAGNGVEAVQLAAELTPDVILMDLRMPELDGLGAIQQILSRGKMAAESTSGTMPRILVLTTFDTDADILRAIESGATGYLLKDTPHEVLVNGVRAAARGETVLAPTVATRLVGSVRGTAGRLTPRETEVLGLVADGCTNAVVAHRLHIGEATVKTHLIRVYNKLGVDNRTEAVTEARHRGWIS